MVASIAVCVALSSPAFAQAADPVPVSTVLNGQINLNTVISDVVVVYDDGAGLDATAASIGNDFTGATRGSILDLTSTQTNDGETLANVDVTVDETDGWVGANSVAISNKVTAGSNFAGSDMVIEQTSNGETRATTTITASDGWGLTNGTATAIGNSATGAAAGYGNPAPLNVTSSQTNNANVSASVSMKTDNTNYASFTNLQATAIGNSATYGADF